MRGSFFSRNYRFTKELPDAIATSVLGETNLTIISRQLDDHVVETAVNDNHIFWLVKLIAKSYCKVRFYHLQVMNTVNNSLGKGLGTS